MEKAELNIMLVNLSAAIPKKDVEMLKVLYTDFSIVKAEFQKAKCAFDLFEILRRGNILKSTDISVLFETVELTGLNFLKVIIEKYEPFPDEVKINRFSAYRQRVLSLGKGFSIGDLQKLNHQYRVDFSNSWELIQYLEGKQFLSQHKMPSFLQSLTKIGIEEGIQEKLTSKRPELDKGSREALTSKRPELDKGITEGNFRQLLLDFSKWYDGLGFINRLKVLYNNRDLVPSYNDLIMATKVMALMQQLIASGNLSSTNLTILYDTLIVTGQFGFNSKIVLPSLQRIREHEVIKFSWYRQFLLKLGMELTEDDIEELDTRHNKSPLLKHYKDSWHLILDLEQRKELCEEKIDDFIEGLPSYPAVAALLKEKREASTSKRRMLNVGIGEASTSKRPKLDKEPGEMQRYSMTNMPRGICLIINNMKFEEKCGLSERFGSKIDEENLNNLFTNLGFVVIVERNKTAPDMKRLLEDVSQWDHKNYDCFVCCILSHGGLGTICGTDGVRCKILDITSQFKPLHCCSLSGKPKLFFMQACQRSPKTKNVLVQTDDNEPSENSIPEDADFLFGYATAPDNAAIRTSRGSWYITELTKALKEYHNTHHILDILTCVNNEVSKAVAGTFKQVPAPQYTLRKQLFLTKS
ncbi:caspase-8-like isoform X2 [Anneissia japonica]|uniref:caspase-8-like isoform X2 n=1 Tax=Anneissia japonica TaxID=1529436 RepID=UPI0014255040|nr:caspase-8-like isoform X2 [Anneissia japonica]